VSNSSRSDSTQVIHSHSPVAICSGMPCIGTPSPCPSCSFKHTECMTNTGTALLLIRKPRNFMPDSIEVHTTANSVATVSIQLPLPAPAVPSSPAVAPGPLLHGAGVMSAGRPAQTSGPPPLPLHCWPSPRHWPLRMTSSQAHHVAELLLPANEQVEGSVSKVALPLTLCCAWCCCMGQFPALRPVQVLELFLRTCTAQKHQQVR
jgi:hypothetical protein